MSSFPKKVYIKNAEIYKIMANPTRLEIMNLIKDRKITVNQLSKNIGARKANVSQHLSVLRHSGFVKVYRRGRNVYYELADPKIVVACGILKDLHLKDR